MLRESNIGYFGRSFKGLNWRLIPGNNGIVDPWQDETPIREKYWNSFTPGQVVVDVGGCFGLYALPALLQGCRVISLEPNQEFLDLITESVKMNDGFMDRFTPIKIGAWDTTEYPEELAKPALEWCKEDGTFKTKTLDELTMYIDRVDMVKIDVEGGELGVIEGAKEMIRKYRPYFLIEDHTGIFKYCENNKTKEKIVEILQGFGYSISVDLFGGQPPPGGSGRFFIIASPNKAS